MAESYKYVVGIDLGTTNTLACFFDGGKKKLVKFYGEPLLPSVLYVDDKGKILVGNKAIAKGATDPRNMVRSSKRYIGDYETNKIWNLKGKQFTPTDVATEILKEVRKAFVKAVNCDPNEKIGAVITIPAYFNNSQRTETRKAGEAAGFEVMFVLEEPVAAAIEAIHDEQVGKKVFVVDVGGGTFDLSVLEADEQQHIYKEIALDGDPRLGGDDFDEALVARLVKIIKDDSGRDLSSPEVSGLSEGDYYYKKNLILKAVQKAKKELSDEDEVDIEINDIFDDYDLEMTLSREEFNEICGEIFDKIFTRTRNFVNNSKEFSIEDIGKIILAGGSCYIPLIGETIEKMFGIEPDSDLERSMLVAYGAALFARWKNGGVEGGGVAPVLEGIIPHSLGVMIVNNKREEIFEKILLRGLKYPCSASKDFTTTFDNQTQVDINVYEAGNDAENLHEIKYHKLYGALTLDGIAPMPKGVPTITVTFDYDDNQRLTVTALDKQTGDSETKQIKSGQKVEIQTGSPVDLMLLLDISGSISPNELSQAKNASLRLVNEMIDLTVHRMGVVTFDWDAHLLCNLTHDSNQLRRVINGILPTDGLTNMPDALRHSESELRDSVNEKIVLMMTDGIPCTNAGYPSDNGDTLRWAKKLTGQGFKIYAIGVGGGIDLDFLHKMAGRENTMVIDSMSKLADAFKSVMNSIMLR